MRNLGWERLTKILCLCDFCLNTMPNLSWEKFNVSGLSGTPK
jgi:hypothetical protein